MEFKTAKTKIQMLSGRLNLLLLICVALLASNIILASLVGWSFTHQKRTIVPTVLKHSFTVSDYVVDASYLRQMALFFASERLNVTPANIKANHAMLLQYTDPNFYHEFVRVLAQEADVVNKQEISSVFYPSEVTPDVKKLTVIIKGTLKRWVGSLPLAAVQKKYRIQFSYKAGDIKVHAFSVLGDKHV